MFLQARRCYGILLREPLDYSFLRKTSTSSQRKVSPSRTRSLGVQDMLNPQRSWDSRDQPDYAEGR